MKNVKILVSGMIDLQTIGRQVVGFVGALLHDRRNEVYLDELWFHKDTIETLENIWGKLSQERGIKIPYFLYKIFKLYSKIVRKKEK